MCLWCLRGFYFFLNFYSRATSINDPPTQSKVHYPMNIHIIINITLVTIWRICVTRYLSFICVQNIPKLYASYTQTCSCTIHDVYIIIIHNNTFIFENFSLAHALCRFCGIVINLTWTPRGWKIYKNIQILKKLIISWKVKQR